MYQSGKAKWPGLGFRSLDHSHSPIIIVIIIVIVNSNNGFFFFGGRVEKKNLK